MAHISSKTVRSRYVKHRYTKAGHAAAHARKVAVRKGTMPKKRPGYITDLI